MRIKHFILFACMAFNSASLYSQYVGINTNTPQGALDINGDIIIRSSALNVSDGTTLALDVNTNKFSYYRLTGPTADFIISGISAGIDGRLVTLFNYSGFNMQLNNEDAGAASQDMIVTGTGNNLSIINKGVVSLQYDSVEQKWIVRSHSKGSSGSGGYWDLNGNDVYNTNSGYVGIGTSTPVSKLAIQTGTGQTGWTHTGTSGANTIVVNESIGGVSASLGTMTNHAFRLKANGVGGFHLYPGGKLVAGSNDFAPSNFGRLTIESESNGYGLTHTDGVISAGTYVGFGAGWFGTISNHPLSFFADNGGALMTILQNGAVGIGTQSPSGKLQVKHGGSSAHLILEHPTNNEYSRLLFTNTNVSRYWGIAARAGTGAIGNDAFSIYNISTGFESMVINGNGYVYMPGQVGIGTTNTAYKFAVKGNIRCEEVVVETGWADYVFAENYKLKPLEEVEKFIKQNKHLPNIPAAKEIEEKGLKVGDVQKRMMEKIEELTLYVIDLKKEIEELKSKK